MLEYINYKEKMIFISAKKRRKTLMLNVRMEYLLLTKQRKTSTKDLTASSEENLSLFHALQMT